MCEAAGLQAISLLDTLDKDVNTFIMRVREWYGWHFPELAKIVNDNFQYARVVMLAKDKKNINDDMLEDLKEIVGEPEIAEQVRSASCHRWNSILHDVNRMEAWINSTGADCSSRQAQHGSRHLSSRPCQHRALCKASHIAGGVPAEALHVLA
jgi:hypothetical protein